MCRVWLLAAAAAALVVACEGGITRGPGGGGGGGGGATTPAAVARAAMRAGRAASDRGDTSGAAAAYREAVAAVPGDVYARVDLAMSLAQAGAPRADVEAAFAGALALSPPASLAAQITFNAGYAAQMVSDFPAALAHYERALALDPTFRPALIKAAFVSNERGDAEATIRYLQAAVDLDPSDAQALMYLGDTLNNRKQWSAASAAYARAIAVAPRDTALRAHAGDTHMNLGQTVEALAQYEAGLTLIAAGGGGRSGHGGPGAADTGVAGELLAGAHNARTELSLLWADSAGEGVAALLAAAAAAVAAGAPSPLSPYHALFMHVPHALRTAIARGWGDATSVAARRAVGAAVATSPGGGADAVSLRVARVGRVLRLGYISRRFERYPGAQLMLRLFPTHNRSRVEVHCFASGPDDGSSERASIAATCDAFRDVSALPAARVAGALAAADLDVLLDYDGLHAFNNIAAEALLGLPPSSHTAPGSRGPVRVAFLGFAASVGRGASWRGRRGVLGGGVFDYSAVDTAIAPPETAGVMFGEKLIYLPGSYQPQDPLSDIGAPRLPLPGTWAEWVAARSEIRAANGLPAGAVVMACFNRNSKIDGAVWSVWMSVLRRVPRAVLWLYSGSEGPPTAGIRRGDNGRSRAALAEAHLRAAAAGAGVDPARLVFAPRAPRAAHLYRHYAADLFLDTLHYGAHTTAADALLTSLPVITMPGGSFGSSVAAGILRAARVGALASLASLHDYEDAVVAVASTPRALLSVRAALERSLWGTPPGACLPPLRATDAAALNGLARPAGAPPVGDRRRCSAAARPYDAATYTRSLEAAVAAAAELGAMGRAGAMHVVGSRWHE